LQISIIQLASPLRHFPISVVVISDGGSSGPFMAEGAAWNQSVHNIHWQFSMGDIQSFIRIMLT